MSAVEACALILLAGVTLYALLAGADFGAGFWDLIAGGDRRGEEPRTLIDRAIGPVWEANHVWLIFVLVVLWTAFPDAYGSILSTLFIPFTLAALGIVLRGAGFAFRRASTRLGLRRAYGAVFAVASVLTPFFLGAVLGGIASGRVPQGNAAGDIWTSWANPSGAMVGALAVSACAFLAAVYLTADARRLADAERERYFSRRAVWSGVVTGGLAIGGILVLRSDAPRTYDRLVHEALPIVLASAVLGVAAVALLAARRPRGTRLMAAGAVVAVVGAWAVAQWPYVLPETLTFTEAAGDDATLWWVVAVFGAALVLVAPSLALLFWLDQRGRLDEA